MARLTSFRAAHATGPDWTRVVKVCVESLGMSTTDHTLGFVYVTEALAADFSSVLTFLRQTTKVEHWVGAVGMGVCACRTAYYRGAALSVMLATLPPGSFQIMHTVQSDVEALDLATQKWLTSGKANVAVVHGDPRNVRLPTLIAHLAAVTGSHLIGGLTAVQQGRQQIADSLTGGGISGVLLGADLPVLTGLTQGCSPIGPRRTITSHTGNIITALDERPALEVLKEDIGEVLARNLQRIAGYIHVGLLVAGGDDFIVRPLLGIDLRRGWVAIGTPIAQETALLFVRRDPNTAQEDLRRMVQVLRRQAGNNVHGALYVSCIGRGPHMFGTEAAELAMICEELGDIPLTGFYANGEISHSRLYGYTGLLTLFL